MNSMAYDSSVQDKIGAAGYYRNPDNLEQYKTKSKFLPQLNNEVDKGTATFDKHKAHITSLHHMMLVMFDHDEIIYPRESQLFGQLTKKDKDGHRKVIPL